MRYSIVSFDLDGTLIDTAAEIAEAANRTLDDFGVPRQDVALISTFIGAGTHQMMTGVLAHVKQTEPATAGNLALAQVLERLETHYAGTVGLSAKPYPGCEEALAALRKAGVRLACLTNKEHRFATRALQLTGLQDYFDYVVGGDSMPFRKPQPEVLWHVINVLGGQAARTAHVGDSRIDVETALAAGTSAWAVPWGYNGGVPVVESGPHRMFDSLPAIAAHVIEANDQHVTGPGALAA